MINDVKNLKESGNASLAELREFLKTLKARNPQEVIGLVSTSLLIQSLVIATIGTVAMMLVFTIVPYVLYGPNKPQTAGTKAAKPAAAATAEANRPADGSATPAAAPAATAATTDVEKAAKVMGLDETKSSDPKKNPLDKPDLDKLLDGL